jgi:hypothetical protein
VGKKQGVAAAEAEGVGAAAMPAEGKCKSAAHRRQTPPFVVHVG